MGLSSDVAAALLEFDAQTLHSLRRKWVKSEASERKHERQPAQQDPDSHPVS